MKKQTFNPEQLQALKQRALAHLLAVGIGELHDDLWEAEPLLAQERLIDFVNIRGRWTTYRLTQAGYDYCKAHEITPQAWVVDPFAAVLKLR